MDDAELLMRIRVVEGSTRAAARSVAGDPAQLAAVHKRGRWLLDAMAPDVDRNGHVVVLDRYAEACRSLP